MMWRDDLRNDACPSDLALDRLRIGELAPTSAAAAHVDACARCAARLAALRAADAHAFADDGLVARLASDARSRARAQAREGTRRLRVAMPLWSGLLAAAAVLLVWVHGRPPVAPALRSKGRSALDLVVRRADGHVEPVVAGTLLHADESLRFIVSTDEAGYLAIVGADARQAVTAYLPATGLARPIAAGPRQVIDGSVVLDDAPGAERMIAVVCARPLPVDAVTAAARKALARANGDPRRMSALELGCRQLSFVIEKAATP
jgi:hypothetical protein